MTDNNQVDPQPERIVDAIAELLSRREALEERSTTFGNESFLEWVAEDSSACHDEGLDPECWTEKEIESAGNGLRIRALAALTQIRTVDYWPASRRPMLLGSPAKVVREAARVGQAPLVDLKVAAGAGAEIWDEDCESWLDIPEEIPHGEYVAVKIGGESMEPLLHPDDIVLLKPGEVAQPGSVVIARLGSDGFVIKRVGRVSAAEVELLSLNPRFPALKMSRADGAVVGTVLLRWCGHNR